MEATPHTNREVAENLRMKISTAKPTKVSNAPLKEVRQSAVWQVNAS